MQTATVMNPKRKSVLLTKEQHKALKDFRKSFNTGVECSEALGIHRAVMERILLVGSGSPENIEKIVSVIERQA